MIFELYEIREVLEGLAARRAARTATQVESDELRQMAEQGSARYGRTTADEDSDLPAIRDIHVRIAQISGNLELQRILSSEIWHYLRANYRRWVKARDKRALGALQHERIAEAIAARDDDLAEFLMRKHIRASRVAWEESLGHVKGNGAEQQEA
jgi:DNA-binding GntR family transcriptional regulator